MQQSFTVTETSNTVHKLIEAVLDVVRHLPHFVSPLLSLVVQTLHVRKILKKSTHAAELLMEEGHLQVVGVQKLGSKRANKRL
jgi:hypothetical protein